MQVADKFLTVPPTYNHEHGAHCFHAYFVHSKGLL